MENVIDIKSKKKLLTELKDEVKDFHPVLKSLLKKLPRIKKVEYTHGPDEKGADFVSLRHDDTLESDEYIGVIVKVGRIVQDLSKIREQIEECDLERTFDNGKKKIRIDEIWIVTNEHITEGAKEKIFDSYASRKIKFIQNDDLIELIDKYLPNFWYDIPIDISDYLVQTNNEMKNMENTLSLLSVQKGEFYIDQDLEEIDWEYKYKGDKGKKPKKIKLDKIVDVVLDNKILFVEGKPGFGKSKLLRYAVSYFSSPINYLKYKLIPIFITYRELVDKFDETPQKYLDKKILQLNKPDIDNSFILFIDGFDEKLYSSDEEFEKLVNLIDRLKSINNCKTVITSRPLNYIEPHQLKQINIKWYELLPLTLPKIVSFFDKLCKKSAISSRIIEDIKKSHLFKQLPQSPIAAILLANLINENSKELPSNLTELYSKYCELMLGRWDVSKGLQSDKEYEAAKSIIINISKYFIENDLEYLAIDEAKNYFDEYLAQRNLDINPTELFQKLTCRSGIVQRQDSNNRIYFKHRTFAEYFYANCIIKNPKPDFINENVYSYYWRNIYFFYIGLLKDCEPELQKIINQKPTIDYHKFTRITNLADYFLAGYTTPYRIVSSNLTNILLEASYLCLDVINNRLSTPLQQLPIIGVVFLFQSIIRHAYSYEFFNPAIEEAVVNILSDDKIENEVKMYTLFFISTIMIELKKENPFDGLIENYGDTLPFPIQFAIMYESDNVYSHSKILKKQAKYFERILKHSSKELRNYIEDIHTKPIKQISNK
jgi:hypothetical protein